MGGEPRLGRTLLTWLRVAVAFGLLAFLGVKAGLGDLAGATFYWGWLALGVALVPASVAIRAFNHTLLLNRHVRVMSFPQALRLALVGAGLGLVLPQSAADLAKAHVGWRDHGYAEEMVVSSVLDRLTSLTAVAVMGLVGAVASGEGLMAWLAAALTAVSLVPVLFPAAMPWRLLLRWLAPGAELRPEALSRASRPPLGLLMNVYLVSIVGWVFTYVIVFCTVRAAGGDVGLDYVFAVAPLSSVARFIPISAGGIGLGEFTIAALLVRAGVPQEVAARSALLTMLVVTFLPGAAGLLIFATRRRRLSSEPAPEEPGTA